MEAKKLKKEKGGGGGGGKNFCKSIYFGFEYFLENQLGFLEFLLLSSSFLFYFLFSVNESSFSFQIGSHPNVYVLDTPGVLPPKILDTEIYSKLALTGMILPAKFCSSMGLDVSYSLSKCVRVTLVCKWSNSHVYISVISKMHGMILRLPTISKI